MFNLETDSTALQVAVKALQGITKTKYSNPVVSNLVLEGCQVKATNLSISACHTLPGEGAGMPGRHLRFARLADRIENLR